MTSNDHDSYRVGQEWVQRAQDAYTRIGTDPKAADRACAAAQIATAHFTAASLAWGDPELAGPPLEPVPDPPDQGKVKVGPWCPQPTS